MHTGAPSRIVRLDCPVLRLCRCVISPFSFFLAVPLLAACILLRMDEYIITIGHADESWWRHSLAGTSRFSDEW